MKRFITLLFAVIVMATMHFSANAQTVSTNPTEKGIMLEFTTQIGDGISYSAFELAEFIFVGQCPSDGVIDSILDEYESEFPENCGEDSPAITVLQYDEGEFLCLQHNADGEIISVCMKTVENGWVENDPQQENILWKLSLLTMFSENLFNK